MIRLADRPRPSPRPLVPDTPRSNDWIADRLQEVGDLLELQGAGPFRVRAYRQGAAAVRAWNRDVKQVFLGEGRDGLEALSGIGPSLSAAMAELVATGRLRLLDRLRGAVSPEEVFTTLPGVGPELAHRIHEELGADTLEELERAAWDGRLEEVPGFGSRRVETLQAVLAQRLSARRAAARWSPPRSDESPSVLEFLSVDREYRTRAASGKLRRIAPHRFNPQRVPWLPILHTERGSWAFQALFSNTARAHRLEKTDDWVVIYYARDGEEGQATVVTETQGPLAGKRVVRGREEACRAFYAGMERLAAESPAGDGHGA